MCKLNELTKEYCQEELEWTRRRLEALAKIESKLLAMRQLAVYAASRSLTGEESARLQELMDSLQAEVQALDQATQWQQREGLAH